MVDFKKAYDSVNRKKLIEIMAKYEVNTNVIEIIVQMYSADKTTIKLGNMQQTIDVTCGIRQGCSISTLLFKMITFTLIEELNNRASKYKKGQNEGNSLGCG